MVEDSQNKEKEKDSHGFIELLNSWLSFPSLEISKSFLMLNELKN